MAKIKGWKKMSSGYKQQHWVNEEPEKRGFSHKTNLMVNQEVNGEWSGLVVYGTSNGSSEFRHRSKSRDAMMKWAKKWMEMHPNG